MQATARRARAALATAIVTVLICSAAAGSDGFTGEMTLLLHKALFKGDTPTDSPNHLILDLQAQRGKWRRVWGSGGCPSQSPAG